MKDFPDSLTMDLNKLFLFTSKTRRDVFYH